MTKYFKKTNGTIIEVSNDHDIDSLKARFEECDKNGKLVKKEAPKKTKKTKKKESK